MTMSSQETVKAGLASRMKSSFVARMRWNIGSDLSQLRASRKSKMSRVTTSAVNKLAATPMVSVTPKPLTEPVPMFHKMMEEMSLVTGDARLEVKARM